MSEPIPAALARLRTHGRYPEMVTTAQERLNYRADLALVDAALRDAKEDLRRLGMTVLRLARKSEPETSVANDVLRRWNILQERIVPKEPAP